MLFRSEHEQVSMALEHFSGRAMFDVAVVIAGEVFDPHFILEWTDAGVVVVNGAGAVHHSEFKRGEGRVLSVSLRLGADGAASSAAVVPLLEAIDLVAHRSRLAAI